MGHPSRVVERLRLRAESESALRRAVPRLEDAFRTATLPGDGARLIVVRRLALGRLPAAASSQTLSRLVETRLMDAGWHPVHASDSAAADAAAVWFRDPLEAYQLASHRVATDQPVDAWFWPLAVPALAGAASRGQALRAMALAIAAREDAPAALPSWVTSLEAAGLAESLVAALRPGDGTMLLRAAGLPARPLPMGGEAGAGRRASDDPPRPRAHAAADDRRECLERLSRRSTRWSHEGAASTDGAPSSNGADTGPHTPDAHAAHAGSGPHASTRPRDEPRGHEPFTSARVDAVEAHGQPPSASLRAPASRGLASPSAFTSGEPVSTEAGGLLFLLPALDHLGFGVWSRDTAAAHALGPDALTRHLFHVVLSRLRLEDGDAAWWLAAPLAAPDVAAATLPWLGRCRRALRRRVGIGLASLVLRPGRLMLTDTHADLFFPLATADVRVRRAGLDVDPGWVPWFAKVVAFHYGARA